MIHLTQILVPYELAARQLRIRDTHDWHQRVWQAFGGRDGAPRDFLTRVDQIDDGYRMLVVSATPAHRPDWCPTDCFGTKVIPDSSTDDVRIIEGTGTLANLTLAGATTDTTCKSGRGFTVTSKAASSTVVLLSSPVCSKSSFR